MFKLARHAFAVCPSHNVSLYLCQTHWQFLFRFLPVEVASPKSYTSRPEEFDENLFIQTVMRDLGLGGPDFLFRKDIEWEQGQLRLSYRDTKAILSVFCVG